MGRRGGRLHAVLADIVAFANTNGGTVLYRRHRQGVGSRARGVDRPEEAAGILRTEVQRRITPPLEPGHRSGEGRGKPVLRVSVPGGSDKPYALDGSKIYVRQETETSLAVREEIIQIVAARSKAQAPEREEVDAEEVTAGTGDGHAVGYRVPPPRTGVEVLDSEERKGVRYHTLRDLRNGSVVSNVTRESARRLWRYAISEHGKACRQQSSIQWQKDIALRRQQKGQGKAKFDLAQLDESGSTHYYYGVTEEGLHGEWKDLVGIGENGTPQNEGGANVAAQG